MTGMLGLAQTIQARILSLIGVAKYQLFERQYIHTMRFGLVASTILLTLLTAVIISARGPLGLVVVGAVGALVALILIYHYPAYGVFLLIATTTIADFPLPRDMTTTLILILVLTVVWMTRVLLVERSFQSIIPAAPNLLVLLWIAAVLMALIWSTIYAEPLVRYVQWFKLLPRLVTGLVMIMSPVAMLLFANFMTSLKRIKLVVWLYVIYGAVMVVPRLTGIQFPDNLNYKGQFAVWVVAFALGQVLFNHEIRRWQRFGLLLISVLWIFGQFALGITWLSGWVPILFAVTIILFLRSRWAVVLMFALIAVFIVVNLEWVVEVVEAEQLESGDSRLTAAGEAFDVAVQHYLFGTGPTGYYFYLVMTNRNIFQLSHNNYVDVFAQTGILGFGAYLAMWAGIGWEVWKTYRSAPRRGFVGGLATSLVAIYCVTLLVMMLGDWVIPFTYTQSMRGLGYTIWPWLWMGLAIALGHVIRSAGQETALHTV